VRRNGRATPSTANDKFALHRRRFVGQPYATGPEEPDANLAIQGEVRNAALPLADAALAGDPGALLQAGHGLAPARQTSPSPQFRRTLAMRSSECSLPGATLAACGGFPTQSGAAGCFRRGWSIVLVACVLLVEDETDVRDLIAEALEEGGLSVRCASDDRAAYAMLAAEPRSFSVLIADINLGEGTTGFDVARRARALNPDMQVVYITGHAAHVERFGVEGGELVTKPFTPREVLDRVRRLIAADGKASKH
jgi:CheY-like chemotaxis protein